MKTIKGIKIHSGTKEESYRCSIKVEALNLIWADRKEISLRIRNLVNNYGISGQIVTVDLEHAIRFLKQKRRAVSIKRKLAQNYLRKVI